MTHFYAVVYGAEWEDIMYFADFQKTQTKLIIQTLSIQTSRFYPFILEYTLDNLGVFQRAKHQLIVLDINRLRNMDEEKVHSNPSIAFDLIGVIC